MNNKYYDQGNGYSSYESDSAQYSRPHSNFTEPPKKKKRIWPIVACIACLAVGGIIGIKAQTKNQNITPQEIVQEDIQTQAQQEEKEETGVIEDTTTTEKHFSIEEATRKISAEGKQALSVSEIYKQVSPSVVAISTEVTVNYYGITGSSEGAGSGVIISEDGYILTNNHVVSGAENIVVTLADGTEYNAVVVGSDSTTDTAVIKIEAQGLTAAVLGDSDDLEVGELAVAIGNPLGEYANSLTVGVISALDRQLTFIEDDGQTYTMNLLQTDTAISPGNSGGALINSFGEVIGITSAKSSGDAVEGIGFAIPINDAKEVIDDLVNLGYVSGRPQIGISGITINETLSQQYSLPVGAYISEVTPGGAADEAGLEAGDVIIEIDGETIETIDRVIEIKNEHQVGDVLTIKVKRNGMDYTVDLTLGEQMPTTTEQTTQDDTLEEPVATVPPIFEDYFKNRR